MSTLAKQIGDHPGLFALLDGLEAQRQQFGAAPCGVYRDITGGVSAASGGPKSMSESAAPALGGRTFDAAGIGHVPSALRSTWIACSMAAVAAFVARTGFNIMKS
jgi:hypothetical protein